MNSDILLWYILYARPDLTRADVERMAKGKDAALGGLFNENVLLQTVAFDLGVRLETEVKNVQTRLDELIPGLNNVKVTATVEAVGDVHEFTREGVPGKVANLTIRNETGR